MHLAFSLLVALVALGAMGSFEFVRESIRKPYVIGNYLYANSLYATPMAGDGGFSVEKIDDVGILKSAKWLSNRELTKENQVAVGREVFRVECESCHTTDSYRGLQKYIARRQWDENRIQAMLASLDLMHNGVMAPFAGTDSERGALAAFLSTIQPVTASSPPAVDGKGVFERNCSMCHRVRADDALFARLPRDLQVASSALKDLPDLFIRMPDLKLSDEERTALVEWVNTRRGAQVSGVAAQGGN